MRAFLLLSVASGALVTAGLWFLGFKTLQWLTPSEVAVSAATAWLMSTAGVGILIVGTKARPEAVLSFLVAGMLAKMLVFATAIALVIGLGNDQLRLDTSAIATLFAFMVLGGVQYGFALKALGRNADVK